MSRQMLDENDKRVLRDAFERTGWSYSEDQSPVYTRASEYLLNILLEQVSEQYKISQRCLEELEDDKKFYVRDKKAFRQRKKTASNVDRVNDQQLEKVEISTWEIIEWNQDGIIRASGISPKTFRKCIGSVGMTRGIEEDVVKAYCYALSDDEDGRSLYSRLSCGVTSSLNLGKASKLYNALIQSFDHHEVTQLIDNLAEDKRRIGILWFPYRLPYSHIWAYKRLKYRIKKMESGSPLVREIVVDLASSPANGNWTPTKLEKHLTESLGDNVSLAKKLKQENIIIILKNVDQKGAEDLKNIIEQFWHKIIKEIPPMDEGGMFLMLWIDRGQTADWKTLNNFPLLSSVCSVNIPDRFQQEHFDNDLFLGILARTFRQRELTCQKQATVDWFWINSNQGQPEDTLKAFYRRFGLKFESHKTDWEEWRR